MDISCQECGAKNPMGAIFCRECGAKLDMNAVQPKVINKSTEGGFKITKLAVRRLISLAISIIIFGALGMLLIDDAPSLPDPPENTRAVPYVANVYKAIAGKTKKKEFVALGGDAVSHYFAKELEERQTAQEGDSTMLFKDAIFEFYDENLIKMDMRVEITVFGMKKNLSMQMIVSFENDADWVLFNVEKAKHGMISLPALQDKLVYSRFERLIPGGDDLDAMLDKLKELSIDEEGRLKIKLK